MATTRSNRHIRAPRPLVYLALLDPGDVQRWMVPDIMSSHVHEFDAREGGAFRISLTYDTPEGDTSPGSAPADGAPAGSAPRDGAPAGRGKTTERTDTFHGRFVRLVPDTEVVQSVEFETDDQALAGEMRITYTLADADGGGTDLTGVHENLPPGVRPEDNELGTSQSLAKLAALVESRHGTPRRT